MMINPGQLAFLAKRRFTSVKIGEKPYFGSEEATNWFLEAVSKSKNYLEFGSGGSTYTAAKNGIPFVAVDSDPIFLDAVRTKISDDGLANPQAQTFHYADIGTTGKWGYPLNARKPTADRLAGFRKYSDPPTASFSDGASPDLVLVDGRFRVACALKVLRMLQGTTGWTLVVDDYTDRPGYHVIADFADIDEYVAGRMAVIRGTKNFTADAIESSIRRYETVPA